MANKGHFEASSQPHPESVDMADRDLVKHVKGGTARAHDDRMTVEGPTVGDAATLVRGGGGRSPSREARPTPKLELVAARIKGGIVRRTSRGVSNDSRSTATSCRIRASSLT